MANRIGVGVGEWHHCYTRGIDRRKTFEDKDDYRRFIEILYLANSEEPVHRSDYFSDHQTILTKNRGKPLVAIGAYCLMPNHFHILIQEVVERGVGRFMQKVGTAYAMYFNKKNERIGGLFVGPFRSRHINRDSYLRQVTQYIHLNPADLYERGWKEGKVKNMRALAEKLRTYEFSSLPDYLGINRAESAILDSSAQVTIGALPPFKGLLQAAAEYYAELAL